MYFRNGPYQRMVYQVEHREACDEEGKGGIDAVGPGNG